MRTYTDVHARLRRWNRCVCTSCVRVCVGRQGPWGAGATASCLPVSHFLIKPIQPGSRLLGFCLCIGCSLEYLPRQAKNSVRESCFQMFTRAASMRMSDGACSRRLESEMGISAKVIDLRSFFFALLLIHLYYY